MLRIWIGNFISLNSNVSIEQEKIKDKIISMSMTMSEFCNNVVLKQNEEIKPFFSGIAALVLRINIVIHSLNGDDYKVTEYSSINEEFIYKKSDSLNLNDNKLELVIASGKYSILYNKKYIEENEPLRKYDMIRSNFRTSIKIVQNNDLNEEIEEEIAKQMKKEKTAQNNNKSQDEKDCCCLII